MPTSGTLGAALSRFPSALPEDLAPNLRTCFIVIQIGSSSIFPVPDEGVIEIGSADAADLRIVDPRVAARHARITAAGGEVTIAPLPGSGSLVVNNSPVDRERVLVTGDTLAVGGATLIFQRGGKRFSRVVLGGEELRHRLGEEIERSVRYGRSLALICIDLGDATGLTRKGLAEAVDRELRLTDVVGWDGAAEIFAVLPETGGAATTPAARLIAALATSAPDARAGFVTCPADASDVDTLISGARNAAAAATKGKTASLPDAVRRFELGGQVAVVVDPVMIRLFSLVERLARSDLPVLITGESGVGKESVALALHHWSARNTKRFVSINCAAIPETLFESELFGYEKGSFTGAAASKAGLFEAANGGTLFLDEVGECPPAQQTKLLRVLETRRLMRLGSTADHAVDVRIVAATNRSLESEVAAGRFRNDLYYRLGAATVYVPPLRQRALDLSVLARAFLEQACARLGRPAPEIAAAAMVLLARHPWPGNLRELKNTLEFVAATLDGTRVEASDLPTQQLGSLPPWLAGDRPTGDRPAATKGGAFAHSSGKGAAPDRDLPHGGSPFDGAPAPGGPRDRTQPFRNLYDEIRELERVRMLEALAATEGARAEAADLIGMPLRTFVTKLKEHAINVPTRRGDRGPRRR